MSQGDAGEWLRSERGTPGSVLFRSRRERHVSVEEVGCRNREKTSGYSRRPNGSEIGDVGCPTFLNAISASCGKRGGHFRPMTPARKVALLKVEDDYQRDRRQGKERIR